MAVAAVSVVVEMLVGPTVKMLGMTLVPLEGQHHMGAVVGRMLAPHLHPPVQAIRATGFLEGRLVLLQVEAAAKLRPVLLLVVLAEAVLGVLAEMGTRTSAALLFPAVAAVLAMEEGLEGVIATSPHLVAAAAAAQATLTPHSL